MNKHVVWMCGLVIALMTGVALGRPSTPANPSSTAVTVGTSFVVEPPMARYIADLDPRELHEQIRDWAVVATVTRLGATPDQAAAATYELPPARLPYLDELYAFEYGRGRRAYLGSRVLLFRDADDLDPQATIGRLADRVREENGVIPTKVEIYLIHDQRDEGTIRIDRAADVTGAQLFSPAYGYVESRGDSAAELDAWLGQVDDLSFAQIRGGHLVLGGRRFVKTRTANLTSEDVAVLYQAHERFGAPRAAARETIQALPRGAQQTVAHIVELMKSGNQDAVIEALATLASQVPLISRDRAEKLMDAIHTMASHVRGPGFSLDPEWLPDPSLPDRPLVVARLRTFIAHPCDEIKAIAEHAAELARAEPDPTRYTSPIRAALRVRELASSVMSSQDEVAVCHGLETVASELDKTLSRTATTVTSEWDLALENYYQVKAQLLAMRQRDPASVPATLAFGALKYYAANTQMQCARYEETRGTEVGMTMFYTDLLAKLWMGIDHGLSAPMLEVDGFMTAPALDMATQIAATNTNSRGTRIWFGPRAGSVSHLGTAGDSLFFEHTFARIYAAESDPEHPGVEGRPNESARRTIGWWDRHYDDVADYEQEFHRLNQIMKWSLVTGALSEAGVERFLRTASVRDDHYFDEWTRANQHRLRFTGSIPVSQSTVPGKECVPIFESYRVAGYNDGYSGGVSAASRGSVPRVPVVNPARPLGARKPAGGNLLGDTTGTASRVTPRRSGKLVEFDHASGVPTRDMSGDIALGTPKVAFTAGARPGGLEIHAGEPKHPIGVVAAEREDGNVKMSWRDGAVEQARHDITAPKNVAEADKAARSGDPLGAASVYEAARPASATTVLDRARKIVVDAAHRRPAVVLNELNRLSASGQPLSPAAQDMLVKAVRTVGTPRAADHVARAIENGLPLSNEQGRLVVERGTVVVTRDVAELPATATAIPPATDLGERGIFLDSHLRIGQEGTTPDLGGQAARWQHRPDVSMSELRDEPAGHPADEVIETSTGTRFDYIPPRRHSSTGAIPHPIVIRQCDDNHKTPQTSDDC